MMHGDPTASEVSSVHSLAPVITIIDHLYEAAALFTVDAVGTGVVLKHANALFLHDVATPLELAIGRSLASFESRASQATTRNVVRNVLERARAASPHSVTYERPGRAHSRPLVRRVTPLLDPNGTPTAVFVAQRILDADRRYLHDDALRIDAAADAVPHVSASPASARPAGPADDGGVQVFERDLVDTDLALRTTIGSPVQINDLQAPSSLILFAVDREDAIVRRYGRDTFEDVCSEIASAFERQIGENADLRAHGDDTHLIVLPGRPLIPARKLAEQLRRTVGQLKGPSGEPLSITLALATVRDGETGTDSLQRATMLMANARKARGGGFAGDAWRA